MKNLNKNVGFTLIELLVVISIIGLIASIAIASLTSARARANDASAIQTMNSVRVSATQFVSNGSDSFDKLCAEYRSGNDSDEVARLLLSVGRLLNRVPNCNSEAPGWAADVQLIQNNPNGSPIYWCVDSTGFGGRLSSSIGVEVYYSCIHP